jgi:hypothetical protein
LAALEIDLGVSEADVDAAIAAIPESTPEEVAAKTHARIAWKNGMRFEREDLLVMALMPVLGLDAEEVDPVWRAAPSKY